MRATHYRLGELLAVLVIVTLTAACQSIDGELKVGQSIALNATVVTDDCMPGAVPHDCEQKVSREQRMLAAGSYDAEIDLTGADALTLRVATRERDDEFLFSIPAGVQLPRENGRFQLASVDIGQPFDVAGEIQTARSRTPVRVTYEACRYRVERRICRRPGKSHRTSHAGHHVKHHGRGGKGRRHRHCTTETLRLPGEQRIEYQDETVISDVAMALRATRSRTRAAHFDGTRRSVRRIELYRGVCR
ncbi:MAG: hypothetical protein AAF458_07110 [Pseudomonadota bacterium]